MIATLNLSMPLFFSEPQAIGESVFDDIAQGVIRVVGGVRSDQHIR